jgi:hypothetical protein
MRADNAVAHLELTAVRVSRRAPVRGLGHDDDASENQALLPKVESRPSQVLQPRPRSHRLHVTVRSVRDGVCVEA